MPRPAGDDFSAFGATWDPRSTLKRATVFASVMFVCALSACSAHTDGGDAEPVKERAPVSMETETIRSFELQTDALVESDEKWQSTTLTLNFVKLDNSIGNGLALVVKFGDRVTCATHRHFDVYAAHGRGGKVKIGERGYQELRCDPYTPASDFADLGTPTVGERQW